LEPALYKQLLPSDSWSATHPNTIMENSCSGCICKWERKRESFNYSYMYTHTYGIKESSSFLVNSWRPQFYLFLDWHKDHERRLEYSLITQCMWTSSMHGCIRWRPLQMASCSLLS
jgi:hypothetical protein